MDEIKKGLSIVELEDRYELSVVAEDGRCSNRCNGNDTDLEV